MMKTFLASMTALFLSAAASAQEPTFTSTAIPDEVFTRMQGKSFKTDCTIPRDSLRYLRVSHKDLEGNTHVGEIVCHVSIADDLIDIFRNLYAIGYPIERINLIDDYDADDVRSMVANNSSSFNFRKIAGTDKLSYHAMGKAIDINPLYNPWVKVKANGHVAVSPEEGRPYIDRDKNFPYKIDTNDAAYKEFVAHGFTWGGAWTSIKDYQHFEKP